MAGGRELGENGLEKTPSKKGPTKKSIVKDRKVIPDPIDDRKFQE